MWPLLSLVNFALAGEKGGANSIGGLFALSFGAGFVASIAGPNIRSILQNVCAPEVRGSAFAIFALTDDLGKGAGPFLVVLFIRACNGDRRAAFNIVCLFWLLCALLQLAMVFCYQEDERRVQLGVRIAMDKSLSIISTEESFSVSRAVDDGSPPFPAMSASRCSSTHSPLSASSHESDAGLHVLHDKKSKSICRSLNTAAERVIDPLRVLQSEDRGAESVGISSLPGLGGFSYEDLDQQGRDDDGAEEKDEAKEELRQKSGKKGFGSSRATGAGLRLALPKASSPSYAPLADADSHPPPKKYSTCLIS